MTIIKNKKMQKLRKGKTSFKPYSDVVPINDVSRKFNFLDEFIYKSELFYLNLMIKLNKHSETIWLVILLLLVTYLVTWFFKNI